MISEGPWRLHDKYDDDIVDDRGDLVASVYQSAGNYSDNAHLIAAAPELLEALHVFLDRLGPDGYYPQIGEPATRKIQAIVAKAEGK